MSNSSGAHKEASSREGSVEPIVFFSPVSKAFMSKKSNHITAVKGLSRTLDKFSDNINHLKVKSTKLPLRNIHNGMKAFEEENEE